MRLAQMVLFRDVVGIFAMVIGNGNFKANSLVLEFVHRRIA